MTTKDQTPAPLVTFKGFDKDLKCRDFAFEIGKEYENEHGAKACEYGFHACEYPLDIFSYYPPTSRFATVEQTGTISRHDVDSKVASSKIKISAEIGLPGLIKAAIEYTFARSKPEGAASSTGDRGAASSTGDRGAASSTGDRGAASSTGDRGAASSTGYQGAASSTGKDSVAMASGCAGKAKGAIGCALFLVHRNDEYQIEKAAAAIVGKGGIKPDVWYTLNRSGAFIEWEG